MTDHRLNRFLLDTSKDERIISGKGRLKIDLPAASVQSAFSAFSIAAEAFATGLSDELDRKFAFRYFTYLQEVAQGEEPAKPSTLAGRPTCRLIRNELERIFRIHFFQPATMLPDAAF